MGGVTAHARGRATVPAASTASPFRRATPADAPAIRRLVWGARLNPLALDPARFLVLDAEDDGGDSDPTSSLVAVGQIVPLEEARVEVRSLVVSPGRRGAGVGTALLAALLAAAPPGTDTAWLTTLAGRAPFYERAGFRVVAGGAAGRPSLLEGLWRGGGGGGVPGADDQIPPSLCFEVLAGSVVGPLLGRDRLVVMRRDV